VTQRRTVLQIVALAGALPVAAQQPPREPAPVAPAAPAAPAAEDLAAARAAVRALGARHADLQQLECEYVQERSSALLREPLRSSGRLRWRREPPCLVFEVAGPRPARLRLDEHRYEVHRPDRRQLERFAFAGPELPRALLDAFAPDLDAIERRMKIVQVERGAGDAPQSSIRFAPTDPALQAVLTSLSLTIEPKAAELRAIAYTDAQGDSVVLRLSDIDRDPELADASFAIDAPPGTRVLDHPARKPPPAKEPSREPPAGATPPKERKDG
jgi:hypothetical protein